MEWLVSCSFGDDEGDVRSYKAFQAASLSSVGGAIYIDLVLLDNGWKDVRDE